MDIKPFVFAVAGAVAGVAGSVAIKSSQAALPEIDLLDPATADGATLDRWHKSMKDLCDAQRSAHDAFNRIRAIKDVSVTSTGAGNFMIEHTSRSGSVSVVVQVRDPLPIVDSNDAGANSSKRTP